LATGHGFANAFGANTGPTAHVSPLYPLLLSLVYRVFGPGQVGAFVQQIIGCGLTSAAYAMLPAVASALELPPVIGVTAGFAAALLPINFWSERGTGNNSSAAILIAVILVYSSRLWSNQRFTAVSAIWAGCIVGIGLLAEPVVLSLVVAIITVGILAVRFSHIRFWSIATTIPLLIAVPWVVRNEVVLGWPVWTRSNLGLELALSNSDEARPTLEENGVMLARLHPYCSIGAQRRLVELGEIRYNGECFTEARNWIMGHPGEFLAKSAARFSRFWFPFMLRTPQTVLIWMITAVGLAGLVIYLRRPVRLSGKILALCVFAVYPIPYYIIQSSRRYRFPLEPILLLFACYFAASLFDRARGSHRGSRMEAFKQKHLAGVAFLCDSVFK
jgi:hypothetical protein